MSTEDRERPTETPAGTRAGEVVIAIDYAIIQHFSDYLYGSPNKAVEELVTNGYDALATASRVYVPGPQVEDRVVIWDDGESMGVEALKSLWWIARSPKARTDRQLGSDRVAERKLIGKFGIGKLASYSVGQRISHLCKGPDGFLLVDIDYRDLGIDAAIVDVDAESSEETLPDAAEDDRAGAVEDGSSSEDESTVDPVPPRHRSPILRLDDAEARKWAESHFRPAVAAGVLKKMWDQESWTLAVIGDLRGDVSLPAGRLGWVLSTGMPLRDDFSVFVNDEEVKPRLAAKQLKEWDLGNATLSKGLRAAWASARSAGEIDGELESGADEDGRPPSLLLPELGEVRATVRFFGEALNKGKAAEVGRSYGFFVYVRGRLLNPDDPFVLLPDPSFGTFYRAQWIIHADELDSELLADRERLRRGTPKGRELKLLQQALYLTTRSEFDRLDQQVKHERSTASLLPTDSREGFREPFTALLLAYEDQDSGFDLSTPKVERQMLAAADPVAILDRELGGFAVNGSHPLLKAIRDRLGGGKVAKEASRAVDLFAIAERLLEGHLLDIGIGEDRIDAILSWRDDLFRAMAERYKGAPDEIVAKVRDASYGGDKEFEHALAELLGLMGFVAQRDGRSGHKDILAVAPIGHDEIVITFEGKGSAKAVNNDDAEISIAASHRDKIAGARHAVVVAREFSGFQRSEDPEVLKQCRATGRVSIVTVDVLADLYEAIHRYFYPLDMIVPVLEEIEAPASKAERVAKLINPVEGFDHRRLLDLAWEEQQGSASKDVVLFRGLWQQHYRDDMPFDEFRIKLTALEAMSRGLIRLQGDDRSNGTLRQSPDIIAAAIGAQLGGR